MKFNKINFLLLAGFAGSIVPLTTSQAASIDVSYSGSTILNGINVGYYKGGEIAPNPDSVNLKPVWIGGDSFTTNDTNYLFASTGVFNAWCVDIYHWLSVGNYTYNVETGGELAGVLSDVRRGTPDGGERVEDLVDLANQVYGTLATKEHSAAFQLAVWAITYGVQNTNGLYEITASNTGFRVDTNTAVSSYVTLANSWLAALDTAAITGNYSLTYLSDSGATRGTQNLVVFTSIPPSLIETSSVPEPGSLLLILSGLGVFGFVNSKQKNMNTVSFSGVSV